MNKGVQNFLKVLLLVTITSLSIVSALADVSSRDPSTCQGEFITCANAFTMLDGYAKVIDVNTIGKSGSWAGYNFNIPAGAVIDSVRVRADTRVSSTNAYFSMTLSGDNGAAWSTEHAFQGGTMLQTAWVDVTNDFSWTPEMVNNLQVGIRCYSNSLALQTCGLDYLPVEVTYTPCVRVPPLITTSGVNYGEAGSTLTYSVTVTNQDSLACGASTMEMGSIIPPRWTAVYTVNSILLNPGSTSSIPFYLTSPRGTSNGPQEFWNTVLNIDSLLGSSSNSTYYVFH